MLEVRELAASVGHFSLTGISLAVPRSSCHVLLGPTGSGKTLILESIIGLRPPDGGRIILDGRDITRIPTEQRLLGYVPQDLALFPHLSVKENIMYPLRIRNRKTATQNGIIPELIESLGITHVLERTISHLSGGERQRTAFARAVAVGGRTLILDEPLAALHESLRRELWLLLKAMQQRYGLAVVMVTHDLHEAFFLGDQISIIMDGKLRQQGNRETVYRKPNSREVANFLGVTNIFNITALQFKGDRRWVECPELGCQLALPFSKSETEAFQSCSAVGIRAEHVELTTLADSSSINRVTGIIEEIHTHENATMIRVRCGPAGVVLEAAVPLARLKEESFFRGQSITLRLPEDWLFPLADPSSVHVSSLQ